MGRVRWRLVIGVRRVGEVGEGSNKESYLDCVVIYFIYVMKFYRVIYIFLNTCVYSW